MSNKLFKSNTLWPCLILVLCLQVTYAATGIGFDDKIADRKFAATGPAQPVKLDRSQFKGAVKVTFDLLPTSMSFDLPWYFCMVTQNGIKFSTLAAETYDATRFVCR